MPRFHPSLLCIPREKYWELLEGTQNGPQGEGRVVLGMLWLGCALGIGAVLLGVQGLTVLPAGASLPEGLRRLFGVLGELESCHRQAQPPAPPAPALLQLQT